MRKILFIFVMCSVIFTSCSTMRELISGEHEDVKWVSSNDTEMNAAIQEAKKTLPLFIQAFQSPTPTQTWFAIKVAFPFGDSGSNEHMWVSKLSLSENQFEGILANEPVDIKDMHFGDRVTVDVQDISDWMIIDDGRLLGGFTIHVLRNRTNGDERKQFDAEFGYLIPGRPELPTNP